jgi:membrane protein
MDGRTLARLARETYAKWSTDDGWLYAAAMAAFAALALAPLLLITLRIAEAFGTERAVLHGLALVIDPIVGHGGVRALDLGIEAERGPGQRVIPTVVSALIALFAGTRLFYALQRALHAIWDTPLRRQPPLPATIAAFLAAGALSVIVIGALTALVFGSAAAATAVHAVGARGELAVLGVRAGIVVVAALILFPVVACLFRWLPGTTLTWADVSIGAATTTVGFAVAQLAIGVYLQRVNLPWTYGSAASVIVVLLWLYYSAYLFLLGAEFTYVYARECGSLRNPDVYGVADSS